MQHFIHPQVISILLYLARIRWSESAEINATDTSLQSMDLTSSLQPMSGLVHSTAMSVNPTSSQPEDGLSHTIVLSAVTSTLEPRLVGTSRKKSKWFNLYDLKANYFRVTSKSKDDLFHFIPDRQTEAIAKFTQPKSRRPHSTRGVKAPFKPEWLKFDNFRDSYFKASRTFTYGFRFRTTYRTYRRRITTPNTWTHPFFPIWLNKQLKATYNVTDLQLKASYNATDLQLKASYNSSDLSANETSLHPKPFVLFDFTNRYVDMTKWYEVSDYVRELDKSKACFVLHRKRDHQQAVFFTLLRPYKRVGFAGVETRTKFDLSKYKKLLIHGRALGNCSEYKIVLRHNFEGHPNPYYEKIFKAPRSYEFQTYEIPLNSFTPRRKGLRVWKWPPVNLANITRFGLQVVGSAFNVNKNRGPSSLEIDWIVAI